MTLQESPTVEFRSNARHLTNYDDGESFSFIPLTEIDHG